MPRAMPLPWAHSRRRPRPTRAGWPGLRYGLLLGLLAVLLLPSLPGRAQTLTLTQALRASGEGKAFPAAAQAQTVALPDEWALTRPGSSGALWYRLSLLRPQPAAGTPVLALYIEHVCSSLDVYLNGEAVHSSSPHTSASPQLCHHPQLVTLPAALWQNGSNTLDIKVTGHRLAEVSSRQHAGALSAVTVGPLPEMARRHAWRTALQVTAPQALSATLLLLGAYLFVLGYLARRESQLAYYGVLSLAWALADARLWLREAPLGHAEFEFLFATLPGIVAWAAVQFLLRHAGVRQPRLDVLLPSQCALLAVTLVLAGPRRLHAVANAWYLLLALEVLAAGIWALRHRRQGARRLPLAVLLGAAALAAGLEFAAQWPGTALALPGQLAQLLLAVVFVLVGLRLVQQHGRAAPAPTPAPEPDPALLEHRVREATAEIERNFRQLAELRVEQVTEGERKRIAADLHDDLGAKLLTIVHTSDSERISTLAREALEEMRLSVRGLTGKPVRLADALGDWRAEVVSRLAQAGIEGHWEAPEDLPQTLGARAYVQTTRILREATSNIIKHSGATHCTVLARITGNDFQFVVQDNGSGISSEIDARLDRGHGLASMKGRAKQMQGQCLVESGPGYGTVIRLTVPLDRALQGS